jgi:peptide/nickel transport system ATP-binding protein
MSTPPLHDALLDVRGLEAGFDSGDGHKRVLHDVSFSIAPGEVLGLVGESGSGKSLTGFSLLGLVDPPGRITGGSILFRGRDGVVADLRALAPEALRRIRGNRIAMVFQDPMMTLNPVLTIGTQVTEAIRAHRTMSTHEARALAAAALDKVGIANAAARLSDYPHQFSGGMRQRVAIAIALVNDPDLVVADEPTTALDVTVQAQILDQVRVLARERGTALLWITHDLAVVASLADRLCVMLAGRIVESGPAREVLSLPLHPYTQALLDALPSRARPGERLAQIAGGGDTPPTGCVFRARCPRAREACAVEPALADAGGARAEIDGARAVRCLFPLDGTP